MTTIKDIARAANLSIGTVSKYLNGKNVLPSNAQAIQKAIEEMHFQVNASARSLRTSKTLMVGVLTHHWENAFFMRVVSTLENALHEEGYSLLVCAYNGSEKQEKEKFALLTSRVDAVILQPFYIDGDYLKHSFTQQMPIIAIDRPIEDYVCDTVLTNTINASYEAVEALIQHGHRRIALLTGTEALFTSRDRTKAYRRAMEDYDIPVDERLIVHGDYQEQTGYEKTCQLLELPERPTALFAATSEMTAGALAAFEKYSVSIPDDMSLVGLDILKNPLYGLKNLAQVYQPADVFGKTTADILLKRLHGEPVPFPQTLRLKAEFITNGSIGAPRDML